MSSAHDVVREFLDRLERGEGSAEDRALADRLAWWASGWKARAQRSSADVAGLPAGIVVPAGAVAVPAAAAPAVRSVTAGGLEVSPSAAGQRSFPYRTLAGQPLRTIEVVGSAVAPDMVRTRLAPGVVSEADRDFALVLVDWDGRWVEVDCSALTPTQTEWLAKKLNGQGAAYRPAGSFQAIECGPSLLFARAVDDLGAGDVGAGDVAVPVAAREGLLDAPVGAESAVLDVRLVAALLAEQGRWHEIDISGLLRPQVKWVQEKLAGKGISYRPRGSFETKIEDGGLWARAVPGGAGSPEAGSSEARRAALRSDLAAARKRSPERKAAPELAVAVLVPPAPFDPRGVTGGARSAGMAAAAIADRAFAAEIRSYEGAWVEIEVSDYNSNFSFNLGQKIAKHGSAFGPAGSFEATVRSGRLYARYLGEAGVVAAEAVATAVASVQEAPAAPVRAVAAGTPAVRLRVDLPALVRGKVRDKALAKLLRDNPGWVDVDPTDWAPTALSWAVSQIRKGIGPFGPAGSFEAVRRNGVVLARYVGGGSS